VDALGLAAGARGDSALVRTGADRAVIEAEFEQVGEALLEERGLDANGGTLVVRRELLAGGTGRVTINGSPATVGVLRDIGAALVELHGQHEHQGLLRPEVHLSVLDAFGGHDAEAKSVGAAAREAGEASARVLRIVALGREGAERAARLRETLHEIRGLDPKPGELDALRRDRAILQDGARVASLLDAAIARLDDGEPPAVSALHAAERSVAELAGIDPSLSDLASRLTSARLEIEDARDTLIAYRDGADFDPSRLESIESRRAALERLLLKWGPSEDDALGEAARVEGELQTIDNLDAELHAAERELEAARAAYAAAARVLTERRTDAAARLGPAVEAELAPLALAKARFTVALAEVRDAFPPAGKERAEFHLAANPVKRCAVARAASGGGALGCLPFTSLEASGPGVRSSTRWTPGSPDASPRGRGEARGSPGGIRSSADPPSAGALHASGHYHVSGVVLGRTHTEIVPLRDDARIDELARMLGGRAATAASRDNAAELLAEAGQALRAARRS
jgi:DNA repair protein RecN (Recombination protein N)